MAETSALWPDIERVYPWVHKAAHILNNHDAKDAATVQRRFDGLVGAMLRQRDRAASLSGAVAHFGKVTRSYRPGLFHCYAVSDLPRTNNDLEHEFGSLATTSGERQGVRPPRLRSCYAARRA